MIGTEKNSTLFDKIGQFTTIPNSVIKIWPVIGNDAMSIYVYLRFRTNEVGISFPSYDRIKQETGISRNRISKALKILVDFDLLEKQRRYSESTVYALKCPQIFINPASNKTPEREKGVSMNVQLPPKNIPENTPKESPVVPQQDYSSPVAGLLVVPQQDANYINLNKINLNQINTLSPEPKKQESQTEKPENLSIRGLPTAAVKRGDFLDAMLAFQGAGGPDVGHFPEEVREYIGQFARSWGVDVPRKIGKGDEFSAWIKEGRLLVDACREFGPEAIREAHDVEFEKFKFTVGRPRAILSVIRAAVTRLRQSGAAATTTAQLELAAANPLATYDPAKVAAFQEGIRSKQNSKGG